MNTMKDVQGFVAEKTLAVAGLSRNAQSFSARTHEELKKKGYRLFPVNPNAESIGGEKCYPSVAALPEKVGGVLLFTPPSQTEKVVREAAAAGIRRIWIQQGAQSDAAVEFCRQKGLEAVSGQCILMFAEPVASFHGVHKWFKGLFGRLPK
jgi:predicted CoA-binding protein